MGPSRDHSRSARPWWFTPLLLAAACGSGGGPTLGSEVDTEPPQAGMVFDGPGADIDQQTDTGELTANWDGFTDNSGSIARYDWAIGTTTGGTEVGGWENVGDVKTATRTGLALTVGVTYYVAVRAYDAAGNVSEPAVSDGVTVTSGGSSGGGSGAVLASSVTQWGITWRFAEPMPVGQFCNGDWWVVGPVEIVEIEPPVQTDGAGRVLNGSM
ncbi:MAG: hypothetical protein KDE27_10045, partial [Planctomycetes bacterium]|nr:hypothetical protein [Planctomycetota bacterium]